MSISETERLADVEKLLRLMFNELGEGPYDALFVDSEQPPYNTIRLTTWKELLDRNLISDLAWKQYRLTSWGWLKAVELLKISDDPTFAANMSKLSATLRGYVTPRPEDDAMRDIFTVEQDSGLAHGFIYNAISSGLLDQAYSRDGGAYFAPEDHNKHVIIIPSNYGLRPLTI